MKTTDRPPASRGGDQPAAAVKIICAALLAAYTLWLLYLLFVKSRKTASGPVVFGVDVKLVPFRTTAEFIEILRSSNSADALRHGIRNLAGNILLFVPYGFFLPFFFGKCRRFRFTLLFAAAGITVIELAQLASRRGICDIDDLIFNLAGVSLGFGLYLLWNKLRISGDNIARDNITGNKEKKEMDISLIAYCGVDCSACSDYKEKKCPGCRQSLWPEGDPCKPIVCCQEKGIHLCGACPEFPCDMMKEFYEESESHKKAYELMLSLRQGQ